MPWKVDQQPETLAEYLSAMSRAVFASGISWQVIEKKWDGIEAAFDGFDPETVAGYTPEDVERLMADARIVRNRKKIEAVIANAGEAILVAREFGSFDAYLGSFADNDERIKALSKRFAFLGESTAHFFLFGIGYDLPDQEKWAKAHFEGVDKSHWSHRHAE